MPERNPIVETLGSFLRRRREEAGMTAGQVALSSQLFEKSSRISQSYLSEIENNGKMPSPLKLLTLARLYGITIAEIYEVLGASAAEVGIVFEPAAAERRLYPDHEQRIIHREVQRLLDSGLQAPLRKLTDEFRLLVDEQRNSMLQVIRENHAEAACVLAGGNILIDYRLNEVDRATFGAGRYPTSTEWRCFNEGESDEFQVSLCLKNPRLKEPVEATIIVPLVRWWAGLKSVIRRLESRL